MKILILGAGQVGSSVAESLAGEANDITVVDSNPDALRHLQEHFDLRTLTGFGSHPDVLRRAGAENADMLLAVTNSDETNMIACQVAWHLFNTPTRIARVRARSYLHQRSLFDPGCLAIDELISPEQVVTDHEGWGELWWEARDRIVSGEVPWQFNARWDANALHPVCA
jgi:trk system potassium uptake protein TrkA